jgi:hypothetical protein
LVLVFFAGIYGSSFLLVGETFLHEHDLVAFWFGLVLVLLVFGETFLHGHDLVVHHHPGRHPRHHQQEVAQDRHPGKYAEINKKQNVKKV